MRNRNKVMGQKTKPSSSPCIFALGSSNTDLVLESDRLPRPGETLLGGQFHQYPGGKGANQAVAAARAGAKVTFQGARGKDDFGSAALLALKREGIDTRYFNQVDQPSGVALILTGGSSRENMIVVAKSANDTVSQRDVRSIKNEWPKFKAVLTQLETPLPAVRELARLAWIHAVPLILNPAPARSLPGSLLKHVHLLTPNEHEATVLSGEKSPQKAAQKLRRMGCRSVVITLGRKGILLLNSEGEEWIPAPKVKAVDTVGAGDCFSAWMTVGIADGLTIREAAHRAVRAAAIAVTRPGAQSGMPWKGEVPS